MRAMVIFLVLGVTAGAPNTLFYTGYPQIGVIPSPVYVSKYHSQDELGQVSYGFAQPDQVKNEVRDVFGNVAGFYSYIGDDGKQVIVHYTAGKDGFKVKSNSLPVAPGVPDSVKLVAPRPVEDTPEVAAAKKTFFEAFNAASQRKVSNENVAEAKSEVDVGETVVTQVDQMEVIGESSSDKSTDVDSQQNIVFPVDEVSETVVPEEQHEAESANSITKLAPVDVVSNELPKPVEDTPEVAEAKAKFRAAYDAAADAAARDLVPEFLPVLEGPKPIMDTPEVTAAKEAFHAAYNSAAALAKATPDFDLDGSVSRYTGYLSAVDGALSPLYRKSIPFGSYGTHTPVVFHSQAAPFIYHGIPNHYSVHYAQ